MLIVGLMSGTSLDGIDAALTQVSERDDRLRCELLDFATVPYSPALQRSLFALLDPDGRPATPRLTLRDLSALNFAVGEEFAGAAQQLIVSNSVQPDLIASHGQTLYHLMQPDNRQPFVRSTLQIGEPAVIADRTRVTSVADFRVADVAAGGQGAPLVSYADYELLRAPSESRCLLNIGGIANITLIAKNAAASDVRAFDTGPGNMLIDRAVRTLFAPPLHYDRDGEIAAAATVNEPLLQWMLGHTYFARAAPKTAGHEDFGADFFTKAWNKARALACAREGFIATATELSARTIAASIPQNVERIIVSGGGAHNKTLWKNLTQHLRQSFARPPELSLSDEFGMPADAKEAMAFAVLGFQALRGARNVLPSCTGASHAVILGKIVPGANYTALMRSLWQLNG